MRLVLPTNRYKKSLKLCKKRGYDLRKLEYILQLLIEQGEPPPRSKPHKLIGNYVDKWECRIEPDWLLVYNVNECEVILHDTGTHSDLFT